MMNLQMNHKLFLSMAILNFGVNIMHEENDKPTHHLERKLKNTT